jgi:hypothetical protein
MEHLSVSVFSRRMPEFPCSRSAEEGGRFAQPIGDEELHPDDIPPSPSFSALQRLSIREDPPSAASSVSRSTPPTSPHQPLPAMGDIPDIPDSGSLLSRMGAPAPVSVATAPFSAPPTGTTQTFSSRAVAKKPSPPLPPAKEDTKMVTRSNDGSKSKSKLSALASSRTTSLYSSTSSRSGTIETESVVTYPDLRPSARSQFSLRPPSTLRPMSTNAESEVSGFSSIARNAIASAMKLEAQDQTEKPRSSRPASDAGSDATVKAARVDTGLSRSQGGSPAPSSDSKGKPMSKLAMLAQAKASQAQPLPPPSSPGPSIEELARRTHTQYLTPIANGPTATTAITTSYQTLASLTPPSLSGLPSRSSHVPTQPITPRSPDGPGFPSDPPRSKLAMKSRKYKTPSGAVVVEDAPYAPPAEMPIFLPRTSARSRASPSAFASLLVDDTALHGSKGKDGRTKERESRKSRKGDGSPSKRRSRSKTRHLSAAPAGPSNGFPFDTPSPDDKVNTARMGTALHSARDANARPSRSSTKPAL